ncbi:unnamed protein product, partial [Durusdinium trenchii]
MPTGLNRLNLTPLRSACRKFHWQHALHLLDGLWAVGHRPGAVPCSEVLRSMARRRRWQPALALLAELRERRLKLDTVCFNIGMHACEQHWEHALQLFADLNNASLPPSVVSYGALFVSLGQGHRWAQVLQLLKPSPQLEA